LETARLLLSRGARVDGAHSSETPWEAAKKLRDKKMITLLEKYMERSTLRVAAIKEENYEMHEQSPRRSKRR
jgi:hypothetical protein